MASGLRAALISIVLACAACSSGRGGGGGTATTPPESSSPPPSSPLPPPPPSDGIFNPNVLNHTIGLTAITVTGNAAVATDGAGNATLDSLSFTTPGTGGVRLFYKNPPQLSELVIEAAQPSSDASFLRSTPGHSIVCGSATCVADNPSSSAIIINPFHAATSWNYQTFGVWASDTSSTTRVFGAFSAGAPTPASTVLQMTGSAMFKGLTAGVYVDGAGKAFATASTMTANADFSNRNIGFSTSDMTLVSNGVESTRPDLRVSGTLTFPSGHSFSGNVTTAQTNPSDRLTGTASGRFYGPSAHEIGGVYTLSRSGTRESMIGGFGGKR